MDNWWTYQPVPAEILFDGKDAPGPDRRTWFARVEGTRYDFEAMRLFTGDPAAVPVLLELLRSTNSSVRQAAIYGLAVVGKKSPAAVAAVESCVRDPDELVMFFARYAIRRIDPEAAERAGVRSDLPNDPPDDDRWK